jgi:hypothetical protein
MFWSAENFSFTSLLNDVWYARQASTVQNCCYSLRKSLAFCTIFRNGVSLPIDSILAANYLFFVKGNSGTKGAVSTAFNAMKWVHNFVPYLN